MAKVTKSRDRDPAELSKGAGQVRGSEPVKASGNHRSVRARVLSSPVLTSPVSTTRELASRVSPEADDHCGDPSDGDHILEARLVQDARAGDQAAFGKLVHRYERRLFRVISRFIRNMDQADDLTQETFLRVFQRLDQFDPSRRFGPWLFRIGVNLCLDHHRRRKRKIFGWLFSDSGTENWPDPAVNDPRVARDLSQEVQQVVSHIAEKYRIVLVLRDLENFSTSEIAAILNRREATIRWRLAEARLRFQQLWEARQESQPEPAVAATTSRSSRSSCSQSGSLK